MKYFYRAKYALGKNLRWVFLPLLAILFFFLASLYNYKTQTIDYVKWSSPDETANYQMAKQYALTGKLFFKEKYNLVADGIIQPRSLRSYGAFLYPVSFLGIILFYGTLAKWTSINFLPYMTPLIAAIGILYYYLLVNKLFGKKNALVSAVILAFFPVYFYFSAHSMFHNVLFVVSLIVGLYYLIKASEYSTFSKGGEERPEKIKHYLTWLYAFVGGLGIGLAATARTSELLWLAPMLCLAWLFNFKKFGLFKTGLVLYAIALAYSPVFYWNTVLYGGPLSSGYPSMDQSVQTIVNSGAAVASGAVTAVVTAPDINFFEKHFGVLYKAIFTFGLKPDHSLKMFNSYIYSMFTWLIVFFGIGFIFFVFKRKNRRWSDLTYVLCYGIAAVILIFYYGSWIFYDNPDPNSFTIGNSYTRYWLPIYLGAIPFVAMAINNLMKIFIKPKLIWLATTVTLLILTATNVLFLLYGSDEGLVHSYYRQLASRSEYDKVIALTDREGVIVTRYHDKMFFPERRVIVGLLTDQEMNKRYSILAKRIPVYYYNFTLKDSDLAYLNQGTLKEVDLKIEKIADITDKFTLYRLTNATDNE